MVEDFTITGHSGDKGLGPNYTVATTVVSLSAACWLIGCNTIV